MVEHNKIQKLLDTAIYYLETIDDSNFDYKMQKLSQIAREITLEKKKSSFEGSTADFLLKDDLLKDKAKLLKERFDNIIEKKKGEQDSVSLQLRHVENQKKLAIYQR
jgi:hypothetical protein